jgi:hypothetical protein
MKVSIDGILGSAQRINGQNNSKEDRFNKNKKDVKLDSVAISVKVNSRLDKIESEFKDIQSSLTKNQMLNNSFNQLSLDFSKGGVDEGKIIAEATFEGENILKEYINEPVTMEYLEESIKNTNYDIKNSITDLKKLQIEVDNIMASNLASDEKIENFRSNLNDLFPDITSVNNISNLNSESVLRLIK